MPKVNDAKAMSLSPMSFFGGMKGGKGKNEEEPKMKKKKPHPFNKFGKK